MRQQTIATAITEFLKAVKEQQESTIFQKLAKMALSCENLGSGMIGKHQTSISVIDRKINNTQLKKPYPKLDRGASVAHFPIM